MPAIGLEDFKGERMILEPGEARPGLHADIISAVRSQEVTLGGLAEVTDLEAVLVLVAIGDAVTFLARRTADLVAPLSSVVWRPVVDLDLTLSEVVTWRTKDADLRVIRALIDSAATLNG
ncbi:LysR substrate-binding domain-containing protein [Streptomyces umbrinus]|uniref:LysR substrate-binding domain-containing protein n=1 Tax=Streptomyces umbrinus TaxID=67370 RepID=UPI003C30A11A